MSENTINNYQPVLADLLSHPFIALLGYEHNQRPAIMLRYSTLAFGEVVQRDGPEFQTRLYLKANRNGASQAEVLKQERSAFGKLAGYIALFHGKKIIDDPEAILDEDTLEQCVNMTLHTSEIQ